MRCGYPECGRALHLHRKRTKPPMYGCNHETDGWSPAGLPGGPSISVHLLDGQVWALVKAIIREPGLIAGQVDRPEAEDAGAADLAAVERALLEVERRHRAAARSLADPDLDDFSRRCVKEQLAEFVRQRASHEAERAALVGRHAAWEAARQMLASFEEWCERRSADLDALDYAGKRDLLLGLGLQVRVWRQDHHPRWRVTSSWLPQDLIDRAVVTSRPG